MFTLRTMACAAALASLTGSVALAASDNVPNLNVRPSCERAGDTSAFASRDVNSCLKDEDVAREQLTKVWMDFSAADKSGCQTMVSSGGPPSYVEFLSCLELKRDARVITQRNATGESAKEGPQPPLGTTTGGPQTSGATGGAPQAPAARTNTGATVPRP